MFTQISAFLMITLIASATEEDSLRDKLVLKVEPVKRDHILYEPVVIRVTLENQGTEVARMHAFWYSENNGPWYTYYLKLQVAALEENGDPGNNDQPPPDEAFGTMPPKISAPGDAGGSWLFLPQEQRTHFHPLLWTSRELRFEQRGRRDVVTMPGRRHLMTSPGTLWVKAWFSGLPPLESEPVPIRFHPVPAGEKEAAEAWTDPALSSFMQHASNWTNINEPTEITRAKVEKFVKRFPNSIYAPYARAALAAPNVENEWAKTYFEENDRGKPPPPRLQVTLSTSKRRYLTHEPMIIAAEIKNISDEPVRIDPRLDHKDGWLKIYSIRDLQLRQERELKGIEGGDPLTHFDELSQAAEPTDWRPVALQPGQSVRKILVQLAYGPRDPRGQRKILWAAYRGGVGGLVESQPILAPEVVGDILAGQLGAGIEQARQAAIQGVPASQVDPLILWVSNVNVLHFLHWGNDHFIPDLPPARPVLEELVRKHPRSVYAFYARAALAHPDDWAERLMNDPNTPWPQVPDPRYMARLGLVIAGGGALLLLLITAVILLRRRHPRGAQAEPASTPSAV